MPDAELLVALKQAKSKKMFFAFVPKGSDGKLIVSRKKIPSKLIAEAKKEIGGGTPVTGKCFGEGGTMVFQVVKAAPASLAAALKKVAKRDTGLTIDPYFQLAGDDDPELADDAEAEEMVETSNNSGGRPFLGGHNNWVFHRDAGLATDASVPRPGDPDVKEKKPTTAAAPAAAPVAPPPPFADGEEQEVRALNLGPWQAARDKAVKELKALAAKVVATKHGSAGGVLKEINALIMKLPSNPAPNQIDKLEEFVLNDDTITAAEEVPGEFHDLDIREPLLQAIAAMKQ